MKGPLTLLFIVLLPVFAMSQKMGRFYYNKQWELTTKDSATYIRMCVFDTVAHYFAGPVTDMYMSGKPQMKGYYSGTKKDGHFTSYYENGQVESSGRFVNDARAGLWTYYHLNGNKKMEVEFSDDILNSMAHMKVISLYDSSGQQKIKNGRGEWYEEYEVYRKPGKIIVTGKIRDHLKDGKWECKHSGGTLIYTEAYNGGLFIQGFTYQNGEKTKSRNGHGNHVVIPYKFKNTDTFVAAPHVDFATYPLLYAMNKEGKLTININDDSVTYAVKETFVGKNASVKDESKVGIPAEPPGGMRALYNFVAQTMHYPPEARKAGAAGKVLVELVINESGSISNISVIQSPHDALSVEAVRVFKAYAATYKWKPGQLNGKPIKQRIVVPVTFKLG